MVLPANKTELRVPDDRIGITTANYGLPNCPLKHEFMTLKLLCSTIPQVVLTDLSLDGSSRKRLKVGCTANLCV